MLSVNVVTKDDDLQQLVTEINSAAWDKANEMTGFDAGALSDYLDHQGTRFIVCHELAAGERTLMGIASSRLEVKPYDRERWLYVDEVDVCVDQRRKGAGKAIMNKLIEIADEAGCVEVWLGTEVDNKAANGLYCSLKPDDVEKVIGYTYKLEE